MASSIDPTRHITHINVSAILGQGPAQHVDRLRHLPESLGLQSVEPGLELRDVEVILELAEELGCLAGVGLAGLLVAPRLVHPGLPHDRAPLVRSRISTVARSICSGVQWTILVGNPSRPAISAARSRWPLSFSQP